MAKPDPERRSKRTPKARKGKKAEKAKKAESVEKVEQAEKAEKGTALLEYLLEVRFDDLPAREVEAAARRLLTHLFEDLMGRGLGPSGVFSGWTPRRLALCFEGLPEREADRRERELGPPRSEAYDPEGEPTAALAGFAERVGRSLDELELVRTEKGGYVASVREVAGRPLAEVLAELVPRALAELRWRHALAWRAGEPGWPVPVRGVLSLLAGEVVPFELAGVAAGRLSAGPRQSAAEPFEVEGFACYRRRLAELGVELDPARRRRQLEAALESALESSPELAGARLDPRSRRALAAAAAGREVLGWVEAAFDPSFLALPAEVVAEALGQGLWALALVDAEGAPLPRFLALMDRPDDPAGRVRRGQERAAAGRLADARFYYRSDRASSLAEQAERLEPAACEGMPGTEGERRRRLETLAGLLSDDLGWLAERAAAVEAAGLLKADLSTAMVHSFPGLRGVMGGLYAREEGYVEAVWQAIYDHPLPRDADDPIPRGRCGQLASIVDRLDTLAAAFGSGRGPTARKDPRGLRALADGLLRVVLEADLELDLDLAAARAVRAWGDRLETGGEELLAALQAFLRQRVRSFFGERGFAFDEIEAALAVRAGPLGDLAARLAALRAARAEAGFRALVLAARRISKILVDQGELELDPELLVEEAEKDLHLAALEVRRRVDEAVAARRYEDALRQMAELAPVLDRFFVEVLVMDENRERRQNRIALLQSVRRTFWRAARLQEMAIDRAEGAQEAKT